MDKLQQRLQDEHQDGKITKIRDEEKTEKITNLRKRLLNAMPARLVVSRKERADNKALIAKSKVKLVRDKAWLHSMNEMHRLDPQWAARRKQHILMEMVTASEKVVDEIM